MLAEFFLNKDVPEIPVNIYDEGLCNKRLAVSYCCQALYLRCLQSSGEAHSLREKYVNSEFFSGLFFSIFELNRKTYRENVRI